MTMASDHPVIAIDGPAASGKSSVALALARRLGFSFVNTGEMYRAVTWLASRHGLAPDDAVGIKSLLDRGVFRCRLKDGLSALELDGTAPGPDLQSETVNRNVSITASLPAVREFLVDCQRRLRAADALVMEGRDIGSVVFPDTPYKFYIDASPDVRRRRRAAQGQADEIEQRDRLDSGRKASPLTVAPDAETIDSSHLGIDEVVEEILRRLATKGLRP